MAPTHPMAYAAAPPAANHDDLAKSASPSDRSEQFVAVTGAESEQVNASTMVVVAYGLFWLAAILFVYMTYRSQARLAARISELEKKLSKN